MMESIERMPIFIGQGVRKQCFDIFIGWDSNALEFRKSLEKLAKLHSRFYIM